MYYHLGSQWCMSSGNHFLLGCDQSQCDNSAKICLSPLLHGNLITDHSSPPSICLAPCPSPPKHPQHPTTVMGYSISIKLPMPDPQSMGWNIIIKLNAESTCDWQVMIWIDLWEMSHLPQVIRPGPRSHNAGPDDLQVDLWTAWVLTRVQSHGDKYVNTCLYHFG